jgi:hypothetical protein
LQSSPSKWRPLFSYWHILPPLKFYRLLFSIARTCYNSITAYLSPPKLYNVAVGEFESPRALRLTEFQALPVCPLQHTANFEGSNSDQLLPSILFCNYIPRLSSLSTIFVGIYVNKRSKIVRIVQYVIMSVVGSSRY